MIILFLHVVYSSLQHMEWLLLPLNAVILIDLALELSDIRFESRGKYIHIIVQTVSVVFWVL